MRANIISINYIKEAISKKNYKYGSTLRVAKCKLLGF